MTLPNRANSGGEVGGGRKNGVDHARVSATERFHDIAAASITALIPVGVARSTGKPSSAARSRAWARCCGGPQLPNQASFDGLKMKPGRFVLVDDMAGEDDLIAKVEADLAPFAAEIDRARAGPGREVEVARRQPRQADRRKQRPHRQIFAIGDEMRLVVAAERSGRPARARKRCSRRRRRGRRHCEAIAIPPVSSTVVGAEQRGGAGALELARTPDARRCAHPRAGR